MEQTKPILEIKDLSIEYCANKRVVKAVNHLDLCIEKGESVGLVGETGAGKTTTALGVMGLIPNPPGVIRSGEILFEGEDLLKLSAKKMRQQQEDRHDLPGPHDEPEPGDDRRRSDRGELSYS